MHRRAVDESIRGRFVQAERTLRDAAALAASGRDVDLRARIMGTRAVVRQRTGMPAEAERLCRQAIALPGLREDTRAVLLGQLGALALMGGRLREALRELSDAIDGLAADPVAQARVRMNRSVTRLQLRDLDGAADDLEHAERTFTDADLPVDAGQAQHNRAYVALLQGDLIAALNGMQAARPRAAASPVAAGICDADRAEVLRDAGLTRDAERLFETSAAVFGAQRMPQLRAEAEFQLACSQLLHDPARARRIAAAAVRRFAALGNAAWEARADAIRVRAALTGDVSRRLPAPGDVAALADRLRRAGFPGEAVALSLTLAIRRSRHGEPTAAPIRVPASAPVQVHLLAHEARATRARARGRDAASRRHAAAGLDALAAWRQAFGSLDLQTSVAMHGNALALIGLDSAVRSRRPDVVFEWSERARQLTQQVVPLRPPPDPELAADLAELRMLRADDPAWATSPRGVALRDRARTRQWAQTGADGAYRRADLDELAGALDASAALISYVFSGSALTALVVTADRRRLVALPGVDGIRALTPGLRADLDMAAIIRTGPMVDVVQRSLRDRIAALSALLLDEPLAIAGDRRLVITAPGLLSGIPWAMLPAMRGRPFTLASSASQWVGDRSIPDRTTPQRTAPFAAGFVAGPGVARGEEEIRAAGAAWRDPALLTGAAATVDALTGLAPDVGVLHVAAHGQHAADNPLFSGLELADGTLFGYDIDRVPRVPPTVILSACESGRSSVRWGEEAIGMARIWLSAGARCVIATPVVVDDDAACELLGTMHTGLARGLPPAEALAAASTRTGLVTPFQAHGAGF
nr:CHAT domain-containing protein [Microbacterium sp. SYP-A9085]